MDGYGRGTKSYLQMDRLVRSSGQRLGQPAEESEESLPPFSSIASLIAENSGAYPFMSWTLGRYWGTSGGHLGKHLLDYLDEFTFRFNRRGGASSLVTS
jgi:hypothetical protein